MTLATYQEKLKEILFKMIGEDVEHETLGVGTIVGFYEGKCVVKFESQKQPKAMSADHFFEFHTPLRAKTNDMILALRAEYELSKITPMPSNAEPKLTIKDKPKGITFDDVIGLDDIKELIFKMVVYPFKYQDIYKAFNRESGGGVLLYGAPGTGKTMIAKAIANEIDAKFYSIKCSDIVSKWFGDSERKISSLFESARKNKKSIIFFDEFDSLGSNRNNSNMNSNSRIVSELLTQIDGFDNDPNSTVLVIAATNRPWDIDSALLRSGRFNKKIYVGLPNKEARINLFKHEFKNVPVDNLNYDLIANKTDGYSSADIVELANEAKDIAILRSIDNNEISPIITGDLEAASIIVKSTIVKNELDKLSSFQA